MSSSASDQLDLLDDVLRCYSDAGTLPNAELYAALGQRCSIAGAAWCEAVPIGTVGDRHNPFKRRVRWYQQTLKHLGLLERTAHAVWRLTPRGRGKLTPAADGTVLLGFSTDLGVALWSRCESVFPGLAEPICLCLTSLPYPLACPCAHGNPAEGEYVDWVCRILEPIVRNLSPEGSVVLNVGQDIFVPGTPARSLYRERLVLALHERLGLAKMDEIVWHHPARPPGPVRWASVTRQQLNASYEPLYWFAGNPHRVKADNRRVLLPHTESHQRLMRRGGEVRLHVLRRWCPPGSRGLVRPPDGRPHSAQHGVDDAQLRRQA